VPTLRRRLPSELVQPPTFSYEFVCSLTSLISIDLQTGHLKAIQLGLPLVEDWIKARAGHARIFSRHVNPQAAHIFPFANGNGGFTSLYSLLLSIEPHM
jgi:hypothetical protein